MPSPSASGQPNSGQQSSTSNSTSSPSTSSTSSGSDSVSFEMAPDTILDGISKYTANTSEAISNVVQGRTEEIAAPADDKNGTEGGAAGSGKENGHEGATRGRTGTAEVSKIPCKRCAARGLLCEVRPGCRACDRCGKMKTRCSLSELANNAMPLSNSEKSGVIHPRVTPESRKRKRSSLPSNANAQAAPQTQGHNSDSPGIDSDTAQMLLGASSEAEETSNAIKHRKKRVNLNGAGIPKNASVTLTADSSNPQVSALKNGNTNYAEDTGGQYVNIGGFKSVNRDEGAGVAALLRATAEADRQMPVPQTTTSVRRKINKSPHPQQADRQSIPGSASGLRSMPSSGLGVGMPTLASLGLEDEQSKTRALAKLLVTVEQLQSRVTELEAAQFRAMEKTAW